MTRPPARPPDSAAASPPELGWPPDRRSRRVFAGRSSERRCAGDNAGGIALTVLLGGALLAAVAVALCLAVTDYLGAAAQARTAADAAALAAAGASPLAGGDGDPQAAATRLARANGGHLRSCCQAGTRSEAPAALRQPPGLPAARVEVAVAVAPRTALVRAVAPAVTVRAAAALRPPEGFDGLAAAAAQWSGTGAPTGPLAGASAGPGIGGPAAARTGSRMLLPAAGPLTSPFGWRTHPILGTRRLHAGIDIGAPQGTPIRAAADGTVVSAGSRGGYGMTVELDHGSGLTTLYAHQSRISVVPGQRVSRGAVIGAVGSTGMSTGPHLHFEVRVNGNPRDPRAYLN